MNSVTIIVLFQSVGFVLIIYYILKNLKFNLVIINALNVESYNRVLLFVQILVTWLKTRFVEAFEVLIA